MKQYRTRWTESNHRNRNMATCWTIHVEMLQLKLPAKSPLIGCTFVQTEIQARKYSDSNIKFATWYANRN